MAKSIFDESNKVRGLWFKADKVGAEISGTLISIRKVFNAMYNKEQTVYELKTEDGSVWSVGSKPAIDQQMRYIKLGQIIGFKYMEERPPKTKGMSPTKIIQVFAPTGLFDTQWLAEQEDVAAASAPTHAESVGEDEEEVETKMPFTAPSNQDVFKKELNGTLTKEEKLAAITKFAAEKLGAVTSDSVKLKVMEATGIAFIDANLSDILTSLENLKA